MPELPEVEVLVRSLRPLLLNRSVSAVSVRRAKVVRPFSARGFSRAVRRATFVSLERRGKYLLFGLSLRGRSKPHLMVGHLGMTGRMYLAPHETPLPKHAAVVLDLGRENFIFEDTRYFGRMTLDAGGFSKLGPEPLGAAFTVDYFHRALERSAQAIKVKLLDQSLVAGLGNIYVSEALFRAGISPMLPARRLSAEQINRLWQAIRVVLTEAIRFGSTVPLNYSGRGRQDGLFYFGKAEGARSSYRERLQVYDREDCPCSRCGCRIKRLVQAGRSTFYCPSCQRRRNG